MRFISAHCPSAAITGVELLSPALSSWLTGTRRTLLGAQAILRDKGIATTIRLQESPGSAVHVNYPVWYWNPLKSALDRIGVT